MCDIDNGANLSILSHWFALIYKNVKEPQIYLWDTL